MSSAQHHVSAYLQAELCHTLGAYRVTEERLIALADTLAKETTSGAPRGKGNRLWTLVEIVRDYNAALGTERHAAHPRVRHPVPNRLPLSDEQRFDLQSTTGPALSEVRALWVAERQVSDWLTPFYTAAIFALDPKLLERFPAPDRALVSRFADNLVVRRDGDIGGGPLVSDENEIERVALDTKRKALRRERFRQRLDTAAGVLGSDAPSTHGERHVAGPVDLDSATLERIAETVRLISVSHLDLSDPSSLPMFTLNALAEAHLSMHAVEAWRSVNVGMRAERYASRAWLAAELDRVITLTTFVYSVGRCAPWIFAEDQAEASRIFDNLDAAWRHAVPTRCMWIAAQVSLLALHRRAYARALKSRGQEMAYNDYHKLQRQIRDTERRVMAAPIHVEGASEFLAGLDAQAHCHIGELYRSEHAHKPALKHFSSATHRLAQVDDKAGMNEILLNSRWQVQLQLSRAKACYELGRHKEALCWYLHAWRAFLQLLAGDTATEPRLDAIDEAIRWLERVVFEPELRKSEVLRYLRPIVDQLDGISIDSRLSALAAETLVRLGHLLFVLNLPSGAEGPHDLSPNRLVHVATSNTLALECLMKAAAADPYSTLIESDILKAAWRLRLRVADAPAAAELLQSPPLSNLTEHWPGGGDDYERVARLAELSLLRAASDTPSPAGLRWVAHRLLLNMFTHTDSMGVRKSQTHRGLMRAADTSRPPGYPNSAAIEFICMRRYSSAFLLLPRPSAFRSLGGGYLVRLHAPPEAGGELPPPFGIAIDPGTDFVENLYRVGFSIADIQMIVVTHDHVDHLGSLDALLSLLYERSNLRRVQNEPRESSNLPIVASKSVVDRYSRVERLFESPSGGAGDPPYRLVDIEQFVGHAPPEWWPQTAPASFRLRAVSTSTVDGIGHQDLSRVPSYGLVITGLDTGSLAIVGDSPAPPRRGSPQRRTWLRNWGEALNADVLVGHISSVPLTELRKLADLPEFRLEFPSELVADAVAVRTLATRVLGDDGGSPRVPNELRNCVTALADAAGALSDAMVSHRVARARTINAKLQSCVSELDRWMARTGDPNAEMSQLYAIAKALTARAGELRTDREQLNDLRAGFENAHRFLPARLDYAFWLRSRQDPEEKAKADLVGKVRSIWQPPQDHSYLGGTISWSEEYKRVRGSGRASLFVVGELSDELGTLRGQIAARLNDHLGWKRSAAARESESASIALTADIGLRIVVSKPRRDIGSEERPVAGQLSRARVMCTNCSIDTDRVPDERFHFPATIREVCVKGENEGLFYNCPDHDPSSQAEQTFLEQLERFDVYGR